MLLMGRATISMAIFNRKLLVYQRVPSGVIQLFQIAMGVLRLAVELWLEKSSN